MLPSIPLSWRPLLKDEVNKTYYRKLDAFLDQELADGRSILPAAPHIFNALRFTPRDKVKVFARGQYAPGGDHGRHLLAHELAHTVQQGHSRVQRRPEAKRQGVTGLVDTPEERDRHEQEEATPSEEAIRRSATWKGATAVHETVNMANVVFGGNAPITWHHLNGRKLETVADADAAIGSGCDNPGRTQHGPGEHVEGEGRHRAGSGR